MPLGYCKFDTVYYMEKLIKTQYPMLNLVKKLQITLKLGYNIDQKLELSLEILYNTGKKVKNNLKKTL